MTPIVGKIYRQKVDSEQGYEDWEYTGITKETPNGSWYAFKNDLGVYYFDENDLKEFKEENEMKIRYYVCGLGYDENDEVTDYEMDFGDFDTYEEAYELFVKLQCRGDESFFENASEVYELLIQLEECEETDDEITCIDVKNEWWIINPNFTFTAYTRNQYNGIYFIDDKTTFDSKEEAIAFAKVHNWDGVMDNGTGEIVWENKEDVK